MRTCSRPPRRAPRCRPGCSRNCSACSAASAGRSWRTWSRWARSPTRTSRTRRSCCDAHRAKSPPRGQGQMTGALIDHLWQSTLFCARHLVDHAGDARQFRRGAPLVVAAGVDQVPRAVFGAASAGAAAGLPPLSGPSQLSLVRRWQAASPVMSPAVTPERQRSRQRASRAAAGVARCLDSRVGVVRAALVARLARRELAVQGGAAGAGRIAGYSHHGCRHRTFRGARVSSGGVAAVRAAREVVRPRSSTPCSRTSANTSRGTTISRRMCISWSRRCSGFIRWCGSSAGSCSRNASAPATRR